MIIRTEAGGKPFTVRTMSIQLCIPRFRPALPVVPVFIPFAGCPHRCVFCAQDRQTGVQGGVSAALSRLDATMRSRMERGAGPCEIAFYGGTFTLLPVSDMRRCLAAVGRYRDAGACGAARCSTRPDAVDGETLRLLGDSGVGMVELGVQSFSDRVLAAAGRGYSGADAERGCEAVSEAGLALGIQLLPGLPHGTGEGFLDDVKRALALRPACMRYYPCLTVEGTRLADMYRSGSYVPWSLDETVAWAGQGLAMAWTAGVPVIRLSVAPEDGFDKAVVAGPRHPALGGMIQARALFLCVRDFLWHHPGETVLLPSSLQGMLYGHRRDAALLYADAGIGLVRVEGGGYEAVSGLDGRDPAVCATPASTTAAS